jgi:hypothetical protein
MNRGPAHLPDAALRLSLEATVGPDDAARALHRAGHDAGDSIFALLSEAALGNASGEFQPASALAALDETEFWHRLSELLAGRGWGRLYFQAAHPSVGSLESADWAEADPSAASLRPSCHFTVGLLANLLCRVARAEVGVLETACRSRGDLHCRFLFGGRIALDRLYTGICAGVSVDDLLMDLD